MLIRALMLPAGELVTVKPDDSIRTALERINQKNFLSIPVAEGKRFVGVISKERIYAEYFEKGGDKEEYLDNTKVKDLLRSDIPVLEPIDEIEKAAYTLNLSGVPFIAVINSDGEFEGIITHKVIFKEFAEVIGIHKGKRLSVIAYDIPGQIAKLTEIINRYGGDIISLVVMDPKTKTEVKEIVIRLRTDNYIKIVDAVKNAGFRVQ
ncbi:CBS domain-containing protein [Fonticella tunisiensis]|nr:CBS domain-containing protein [Fonticella tunisiensis]